MEGDVGTYTCTKCGCASDCEGGLEGHSCDDYLGRLDKVRDFFTPSMFHCFTTYNRNFIAFPFKNNQDVLLKIADDKGRYYGIYTSIDAFRRGFKKGKWKPIGKCKIELTCLNR